MKTKKQKLILFDMDGTLIDSVGTIAYHFIKALDDMNIKHNLTQKFIADYLEIPFEELNVMFNLNMSHKTFHEFIEKYRYNYLSSPLNGTKVFPGVHETLKTLRERNYLLSIATGKHIDSTTVITENLKLTPYFHHVQGWEVELKPKPEPDILLQAIKKLKVPVENCIMVGDTHVDILAGKALKIPTVAATYGFGKLESLKKTDPDFFINSISELINIMEKIK
ncbi:MAG: hypothetical protein ACD_79C00710G0001 [uncultured bacterium]|nr:MAG: hypothetical protein ACD_79C00710G0001 [uncultured bacterium]